MNNSSNLDELSQTRSRVLSVIDFLSALHARRHPPVHDISKYGLDLIREASLRLSPGVSLSPSNSAWLTVDYIEVPPRPQIPDDIVFIVANPVIWSHLEAPCARSLGDESTDEERTAAEQLQRWVEATWSPWAERLIEIIPTKDLYRRLFELRERVENDRDGVELVWGFGRALWQNPDVGLIDHPMMTFGVEIDIDPQTNRISVRPDGALNVESLYLSDVPLVDRQGFNAIKSSHQNLEVALDPWDADWRVELVRRIIRCFDHNSVVSDTQLTGSPIQSAQADTSWVLYLRRRQPDYQGFLDAMRNLYMDDTDIPTPLATLVLAEPSRLDEFAGPLQPGQPRDRLLLPLPANDEQRRILENSQTRSGVTVQGPPGTGKSHTIANLISHYVAYGKRVLVVAEKEQALRVLSEKVPVGIRDLTVSVLGGDEESRRQLENSIQNIQTRVSGVDRSWVDGEIARLSGELDDIDREIAATSNRLASSVQRESERLIGRWGGIKDPSVGDVAAWVSEHRGELGYIPDEVLLTTSAPLSAGELAEAVELLQRIGIDTAQKCAVVLPELRVLPTAARLAELFAVIDSFILTTQQTTRDLPDLSKVDSTNESELSAITSWVEKESAWLLSTKSTWLEQVLLQLDDAHLAGEWPEFMVQVRSEREQILTTGRQLEAHHVTVPTNAGPEFEATVHAALERLEQKGKLGIFSSGAKKALYACSIDGRQPQTAEDVRLCLAGLRRQHLRRLLMARWTNRMERVSGPKLDDTRPEDAIGVLLEQLKLAIDADSRWHALRDRLNHAGIATNPEMTIESLNRVRSALSVAQQRKVERRADHVLTEISAILKNGSKELSASPLWILLDDALDKRLTDTWDRLRNEVSRLQEITPQSLRLLDLLQHLRAAAPVWTAKIISEPTEAHDPGQMAAAWQWRQMDCWVAQIITQDDPEKLRRSLEALSERRRNLVAELVEQRAWRRLAENLGDRQHAALNKYIAAVNRYGKTGGKYAARFSQMMREALNDSKSAVPVWIMTTQRALTGFRPDQVPPFDVLIIDEASQIGIEALPLLSLGRSTIVVGDDQQTSPENVGQNLESYFELLESHVSKIPDYKTLFGDGNSLYNLASLKYPGVIMLTEHFRCLPDIIEFSNRFVYGNRIVPLRDKPPSDGWRPLGSIKVLDGYRAGRAKLNRPEAEAVVDLVEKCCQDQAYEGMDFGIISLLGTEQSKLIWELLFDRLGPDVMRQRRIRCGEAANFQGDERDVMVVSLVAAVDPSNPNGRIAAATSRSDMRRINVAASRARQQMWVVHSLDASTFNDDDLRGSLIRHCSAPGELSELQSQLRFESPFEEAVVSRILARGYRRVRTQHKVGQYRIDIVVEGPEGRLAVECDGERWHGVERWEADRARQEVLERAGWTFSRIRGSAFYLDPDVALEPLWTRLEELGIPTGDWRFDADARRVVYEVGSTPTFGNNQSDKQKEPTTPSPHQQGLFEELN
jgi:very-short-patch-repair endonuclease